MSQTTIGSYGLPFFPSNPPGCRQRVQLMFSLPDVIPTSDPCDNIINALIQAMVTMGSSIGSYQSEISAAVKVICPTFTDADVAAAIKTCLQSSVLDMLIPPGCPVNAPAFDCYYPLYSANPRYVLSRRMDTNPKNRPQVLFMASIIPKLRRRYWFIPVACQDRDSGV